jgi:hypothetical protein
MSFGNGYRAFCSMCIDSTIGVLGIVQLIGAVIMISIGVQDGIMALWIIGILVGLSSLICIGFFLYKVLTDWFLVCPRIKW